MTPCVNHEFCEQPASILALSFQDGELVLALRFCWECWDEACENTRRICVRKCPPNRITFFFELEETAT